MKDNTPTNENNAPDEVLPLSNTDRLRLHLAEDGLGRALLDAWLSGPKPEGPQRMINAINNFQAKKQVKNEPITDTEN